MQSNALTGSGTRFIYNAYVQLTSRKLYLIGTPATTAMTSKRIDMLSYNVNSTVSTVVTGQRLVSSNHVGKEDRFSRLAMVTTQR